MKLRKINLHLLDGGAEGTAGPAQTAEGTAQVAEGNAAEKGAQVAAGQERKSFDDLIENDYKEDFKKAVEKTLARRLKNTEEAKKSLETLTPTLGLLAKRYGLDDQNLDFEALTKAVTEDDAYYEQAAMAAGVDLQTFKKMEQMRMQNAQLESEVKKARLEAEQKAQFDALVAQEAEIKQVYPSFSMQDELDNQDFARLVFNGVPAKTAYEVAHKDEIIGGAMQFTAKKVEKQVVDNIMAGQTRPNEQGNVSQQGVVTKVDPSKLSKEQRAEIRQRAMRGERITFD